MSLQIGFRRTLWYVFGSPNRDRLRGEIKQIRIELAHPGDDDKVDGEEAKDEIEGEKEKEEAQPATETALPLWKDTAWKHLDHARECVKNCRLQDGWSAAHAARRTLVLGMTDTAALKRQAQILRREADTDKIGGWRAKAIADLICTKDGEIRDGLTAEDIVAALALRDDRLTTTYLRIDLRRRHLFNLLIIVIIALAGLMGLARWAAPSVLPDAGTLFLVILLGALGACLSVAQGMIGADVDARIPAQLIGAFVVWMRPFIGAAAAVAVVLILRSHALQFPGSDSHTVQLVFAIVAGYSERFLVGAIETVSEKAAKSDDAGGAKKKAA